MKRLSSLFLAVVCILSLVVPSFVLAANSVPAEALKARESVYRVLCEDSEYTYSGSSFVAGADVKGTYLITNYHVIEGANLQSIAVVERDGTELPASVVGYDTDYDLCILQTNRPIKGAVAIGIASGDAAVGEAVYALGFPGAGDYLLDDYAYAVEDITLTDGIISAVKTVTTGAKRTTFLQMNAAINPGSSGGPLVNGMGEVVGINTLGILEAQDVYAAVSSPHILEILRQYSVPLASVVQEEADAATAQTTSPWVWPVVGVCMVLALVAGVLLILRSRRLTLSRLLSRRLQGYSPEEAMSRLSPVFHALSQLHARGEAYGHIYPANLIMDKHGMLHLGGRRRKYALNDNTRPYTPMEQYDAQTIAGTYSDIYALGAVLFAMLTCTPPPDVMSRLQHDSLEERLKGVQGLSGQIRDTLLKAMSLKKEERLHDMERFLRATESQPQIVTCLQPNDQQQTADSAYVASEQASQTQTLPVSDLPLELPQYAKNAHWYDVPGAPGYSKSPLEKKKRLKILALSCGGALLLTMIVLLVINEAGYQRAVTCCEAMDFAGASEAVGSSFLFYRDTATLTDYVSAGRYLQVGRFQEARDKFLALGDYRNAKDMALECDYQRACAMLKNREFHIAKPLFQTLGTYSDAKMMVMECDYQRAKDYLQNGSYAQARALFQQLSTYRDSDKMVMEVDYQHAVSIYDTFVKSDSYAKQYQPIEAALDIFRLLGGYSNSAQMLEQVKNEIYTEGQRIYQANLNDLGYIYNFKYYFSMIEDYHDSILYLEIYNTMSTSDEYMEQYHSLMRLWDFIPARQLILSDAYISYYLVGTWRGEGRNIKIWEKSDGSLPGTSDIPGANKNGFYKISNLVFYLGSDERGWEKVFTIDVVDKDTIEIYAYKNGKTYTLSRQ